MTLEEIEKNYTRLDGKDPPAVKLFRDLIAIAKAAQQMLDANYPLIYGKAGPHNFNAVRDAIDKADDQLRSALFALEAINEKGSG
jgi:hypothetical protein